MMYRELPYRRAGSLGLVAFLASGCVLFAAGAGAGGGVYFTTRGVESVISAAPHAVFSATQRTFRTFDIEQTSLKVERDGDKREVEGKSGERDTDVKVTLERQGDNTRVEVTARTSLVTWDKDFAREIIEKIVEFAS